MNPWHADFLAVEDVRYSQAAINKNFCTRQSIFETAIRLITGDTQINDIPPIRVVKLRNGIYSCDNRRLWCFKTYQRALRNWGHEVPIRVPVSYCSALPVGRMSTKNAGYSVELEVSNWELQGKWSQPLSFGDKNERQLQKPERKAEGMNAPWLNRSGRNTGFHQVDKLDGSWESYISQVSLLPQVQEGKHTGALGETNPSSAALQEDSVILADHETRPLCTRNDDFAGRSAEQERISRWESNDGHAGKQATAAAGTPGDGHVADGLRLQDGRLCVMCRNGHDDQFKWAKSYPAHLVPGCEIRTRWTTDSILQQEISGRKWRQATGFCQVRVVSALCGEVEALGVGYNRVSAERAAYFAAALDIQLRKPALQLSGKYQHPTWQAMLRQLGNPQDSTVAVHMSGGRAEYGGADDGLPSRKEEFDQDQRNLLSKCVGWQQYQDQHGRVWWSNEDASLYFYEDTPEQWQLIQRGHQPTWVNEPLGLEFGVVSR